MCNKEFNNRLRGFIIRVSRIIDKLAKKVQFQSIEKEDVLGILGNTNLLLYTLVMHSTTPLAIAKSLNNIGILSDDIYVEIAVQLNSKNLFTTKQRFFKTQAKTAELCAGIRIEFIGPNVALTKNRFIVFAPDLLENETKITYVPF